MKDHSSLARRKMLPFVIGLLSCSVASAQTACDSVEFVSVEYKAVNSQVLEMVVLNESSDPFFYPEFVMYDLNSDTLAIEIPMINWLEPHALQSQFLQVKQGVQLPDGPFDVELELFTEQIPASTCLWDLNVDLCPTGACQLAEFYVINTDDTLEVFDLDWAVKDMDNNQLANGTFHMNDQHHTKKDTACLPPGEYIVEISMGGAPISNELLLGVTSEHTHGIGTNTALEQDPSPEDLQFHWYENCIPSTNSISEMNAFELTVVQRGNLLLLSSPADVLFERAELIDMSGKLLLEKAFNSISPEINIRDLPLGAYLLRTFSKDHGVGTKRILLN